MKNKRKNLILSYVLGVKEVIGLRGLPQGLENEKERLKKFVKNIPFKIIGSNSYLRNIVAREYDYDVLDKDNFEVVVANWIPTGSPCHIHGHPRFMYYQIISGKYIMHLYEVVDNTKNIVTLVQSMVLVPGNVYSVATTGFTWSNVIHSVECIEAGQTLHIYSNDGTKGSLYTKK